jgi:hypothetical protein
VTRTHGKDFPLAAAYVALGTIQLATALWMVLGPRSFFEEVGPYGFANPHYIRDVATFTAATGGALLVAARHASWRVPVLGTSIIQYALHTANHIADADNALTESLGPLNVALLGAGLLVQLVMLRFTLVSRRASSADARQPL